jgi:hypothetical protein
MTRVRVRKGDVYECTTGGKKFWIQYLGTIDEIHPGIRVFSSPDLSEESIVRKMSFVGILAGVRDGKWERVAVNTAILPMSEDYLYSLSGQDEGGPFITKWILRKDGESFDLGATLPTEYLDHPLASVVTWETLEEQLVEGTDSEIAREEIATIERTRVNWAEISAGFKAEAERRAQKPGRN